MALGPGARLGPYAILQPLGAGGMGEVHRARHLKLGRDVAIKVLPAEVADDESQLARFEREARTASALNHPNIVTIYDIDEHEGTTFIAMELVEGRTLRDLIAEGPLPIERSIAIVRHVVDALAKAHAAGIVHRDIKPANVMITDDGLVKVLDFGLAKPLGAVPGRTTTGPTLSGTGEGMIVGTPHYMSPEQLSGGALDHRSDQFAVGVLLYEMIAGKLPFDGPSLTAVISAIVAAPTPALSLTRPEVPPDLERIVSRCLEKEPARRFPDTASLAQALRECEERRLRGARGVRAALRRPAVVVGVGLAVGALGLAGWLWARGERERWAEREALDEIAALIDEGRLYDAYRTAREAERYRPDDPALQAVFDRITLPAVVNTEPAGASVFVKGYGTPDAEWERLGATPLSVRLPYAMTRVRITAEGYEPFEGAPFSAGAIGALARGLVLDRAGTAPAGMVRVPPGVVTNLPVTLPHGELPQVQLASYFLDRYEVTNREYQEFVDAGGYQRQEWWPMPPEDGTASWQEMVDGFRDRTGRPGPSTWELGGFPAGMEDHPVGGVSWYEAVAYCAFAGRSLPTIYHWFHAIGQEQLSDILVHSNMDGRGTAPVGQFRGLAAYGTYDMAGNVREWVWNAAGSQRYVLGGAWNEPSYMFKHLVAADPLGREPVNGLRCAKYVEPPPEQLSAPVMPRRRYDRPEPLSDEAFALARGMYAYDRTRPLDARVERVDDSAPAYRRETVSFRTAYDDARMEVHLLLPREAPPPYQSVIWYPGGDVYMHRSSERFSSTYLFDFIPRGGRVLVHPVYKGMYERFEPPSMEPATLRDLMIRWAQDIARTIDYLETREDFDATRVAYYGFSSGGVYGPVFTAVEPRLKASILLGGGLVPLPFRPESHPAIFAPRSATPTLMINGVDDFIMPHELSQKALFDLLGAPPAARRLARLEGGHIPSNRLDIIREVLDWLDAHLGPVARTTATN